MATYTQLTDDELIEAIKQNEGAFDEIYERYWAILYRSAYNVLRDQESCNDIIQEVFIWFWDHREHLKVNSLKGYLISAVKYKVANYIRRGVVRDNYQAKVIKDQLDQTFPDELLELKQLKETIDKFVFELPERCQEIFNLSRNEHLSNKEISNKLGISEKTVENQINRALKPLRIKLGRFSALISLI